MNTNRETKSETDNKTETENQASKPADGKRERAKGLRGKEPSPEPTQLADRIKIGLDVGLNKYAFCRQIDGSLQEPPRVSSPEHFKDWLLGNKRLAKNRRPWGQLSTFNISAMCRSRVCSRRSRPRRAP